MSAATQNHQFLEPHMKLPLIGAVLFHALIVFVAITGLPYITPEHPVIDNSITVELINVDDESKKPPERMKRQPPPKLSKKPPKPVMPQQLSKKPPKPVAPKPPELSEDIAPPEKNMRTEAVKPKAKPEKPKPKPVRTSNKEEQPDEFKSLLRNLMPTEDAPVQDAKPRKGEQSSMLTRFSATMNQGELRALKSQLDRCWSVMAGSRYAENLVVDLKLFVNPDRSIRDVHIVNRLRYSTDSYFRAAADSARRAVFRCSPLDVPPSKHELWNEIDVRFDPGKML